MDVCDALLELFHAPGLAHTRQRQHIFPYFMSGHVMVRRLSRSLPESQINFQQNGRMDIQSSLPIPPSLGLAKNLRYSKTAVLGGSTTLNKNMRQVGVAHEMYNLFMSDEEKHGHHNFF